MESVKKVQGLTREEYVAHHVNGLLDHILRLHIQSQPKRGRKRGRPRKEQAVEVKELELA